MTVTEGKTPAAIILSEHVKMLQVALTKYFPSLKEFLNEKIQGHP